MKRGSWILKMVAFGIVVIAAVGLVTKMLWNWLMPELFSLPAISYWQALGLLLLSKILFWSFGKRSSGGHRSWKPYWKEKWNSMTEEEKAVYRQKMKEKCGWGRPIGQAKNPIE
ncbi:MAG: hypothetical protein RLN86_10045 [Cyclobacteriaceae bacterium]